MIAELLRKVRGRQLARELELRRKQEAELVALVEALGEALEELREELREEER